MPIGTRLGFLYSWKSKMIIDTKTQFLNLFKREQGYNIFNKFIIIAKLVMVRQSIITGTL